MFYVVTPESRLRRQGTELTVLGLRGVYMGCGNGAVMCIRSRGCGKLEATERDRRTLVGGDTGVTVGIVFGTRC